jgi:hypothetical protein
MPASTLAVHPHHPQPGGWIGRRLGWRHSTTTRPCTGLPTAGWHTMALISRDPSGTFSIDGGQGAR